MRAHVWLAVAMTALAGCGKQQREVQERGITIIPECKSVPQYLSAAGFTPGKPFGFSVAEKGVTGLSLVQFAGNGVSYKLFRLPGWDAAGNLGAVVTDKEGNNYVIPRPFINTLKNDPRKQNIIYRVSGRDGAMVPYLELTPEREVRGDNPYGLLGLVLDCENDMLYASSVAGSDAGHETGAIYALTTGDKPQIAARLTEVDAMGLGIAYLNGEKQLFFGKARNSDIFRVRLNADGSFSGQPEKVLTLEMLGERGDDKPRKIRFDAKGQMQVAGISFNFNLANSADKQENIYTFAYDQVQEKWILLAMRKGLL